ncbi:MAG: hypothetical protein B7X72_12230, partial [Sphingobacteriia bacterium 39-39-8]
MKYLPNIYTICLEFLIFILLASCGNKPFTSKSNSQLQPIEVQTKKLSIVVKLKENAQLPINERIALYHKIKKEN